LSSIAAGDSDLIPKIKAAQDNGILIRLVHGPAMTYDRELWQKADERFEITEKVIFSVLQK